MGIEDLVSRYQCPSCAHRDRGACSLGVLGMREDRAGWARCAGHEERWGLLGLRGFDSGGYPFPAGLPRGFAVVSECMGARVLPVRLWTGGRRPDWGWREVPVWAFWNEVSETLFVRTYLPLVDGGYVDVVEGGHYSLLGRFPGVCWADDFVDGLDSDDVDAALWAYQDSLKGV